MKIAVNTTVVKLTIVILCAVVINGCTSNRPVPTEIKDPFEKVNRAVYKFNDTIDRVALKPVAVGYKKVTPTIVRRGVSNFFGNLGDVSVAANSFLQGKFEQGLSDTARVAVNTVIGVGGIFDVATKLELERHNEDFGQTLGVWGVPEGPYLVLPFFGAQTLRGTVGLLGDSQIEPLNSRHVSTSWRGKLVALNTINARTNLLAASSILESSLDPYVFVRDGYLNWRRRQIHDGAPPPEEPDEDNYPTDKDNDLDEFDDLDELDELDELDLLDAPETPYDDTNPAAYPQDELDLLDELD